MTGYIDLKREGDRVKIFFMEADGTCVEEREHSVEEVEEFLMDLTGMPPHEAQALLVDTTAH